MGKRGTEGLISLKKDSFAINTNSEGGEYLELVYNESTKKRMVQTTMKLERMQYC